MNNIKEKSIVAGKPDVVVQFMTDTDVGETVAKVAQKRKDDHIEIKRREALNHPRVIEAMQIFPEAAGNIEVEVDVE